MTRARARAIAPALAAIATATAIWLPSVHLLHEVRVPCRADAAVAPRTRALTARQLQLWQDPASKRKELARMRRSNAEWASAASWSHRSWSSPRSCSAPGSGRAQAADFDLFARPTNLAMRSVAAWI